MTEMTGLNLNQSDSEVNRYPDVPGFLASAAAEQEQEQRNFDPLLGVRVVLLIATGVSLFLAPVFISLLLGTAWVVSLVWPKK